MLSPFCNNEFCTNCISTSYIPKHPIKYISLFYEIIVITNISDIDDDFIKENLSIKGMSSVIINPHSKVHAAKMGTTSGTQDPGWPHVGPMNLAIWEVLFKESFPGASFTNRNN